jgi:hypothetical protein
MQKSGGEKDDAKKWAGESITSPQIVSPARVL